MVKGINRDSKSCNGISISQVSLRQAQDRLARYGLEVFWMTCLVANGKYEAQVADYSDMKAYKVRYAIAIYEKEGDMIERFNVMK